MVRKKRWVKWKIPLQYKNVSKRRSNKPSLSNNTSVYRKNKIKDTQKPNMITAYLSNVFNLVGFIFRCERFFIAFVLC